PGNRENPEFIGELAASVPKDTPVMFLCRSGARSHAAAEAAARAGWSEAYNVLEGFEGDKDPQEHRNTVGGWRKAGLPWVQSSSCVACLPRVSSSSSPPGRSALARMRAMARCAWTELGSFSPSRWPSPMA
ncbi:MAG TPA: rhodanese-like domain-containing protein, partial [Burkholderiales bacterium]|nr:rhodanese-like domain-containing protein [Burkholderiales bacterium]